MVGYALFLIPMAVAFGLLARRHGIRQALLDLIAFNLFFSFDFASLLPGETSLQLLHVLLLGYMAYETLGWLQRGRYTVRLRFLLVLALALLLVGWVGIASFENRLGDWGPVRVVNYVVRVYLFSALFIFVGAALAHPDRLRRFLIVFCLGGMAVGAINLVQTVSGGRLLTGDTSPNYLGIFQPMGAEAFQARMSYLVQTDFIRQVRQVSIGGVTLYRAFGTFNGAIASLCASALVALCLITSRDRMPGWLPVALGLMVVGIVAAYVRTILATFLLLAAMVLLLRFRAVLTSRQVVVRLLPMLCLALIVGLLLPPVQVALGVVYDSFFGAKAGREVASLNGRIPLWGIVLVQISSNPLFGTNRPITMLEVGWGDNANPEFGLSTHNSFLEVAYNAGVLPAVILAGLYAFCLVRSAVMLIDRRYSANERTLFLALFVAVAALLIVNQTGDWMNAGQVAGLFWIICGCLATYPRPTTGRQPEPLVAGPLAPASQI